MDSRSPTYKACSLPSRCISVLHPSITTTDHNRQLRSPNHYLKPPPSLARPVAKQADRQKLKDLQVTSPDIAWPFDPLANRAQLHTIKKTRQATATVPDARYMLFLSRSHDDLSRVADMLSTSFRVVSLHCASRLVIRFVTPMCVANHAYCTLQLNRCSLVRTPMEYRQGITSRASSVVARKRNCGVSWSGNKSLGRMRLAPAAGIA